MSASSVKRCVVAYATGERQFQWTVDVAAEASIGQVIEAARRLAPRESVPWESAQTGIFGEIRGRGEVPADGDRIELYRPLRQDPKARRRQRLNSRGGGLG